MTADIGNLLLELALFCAMMQFLCGVLAKKKKSGADLQISAVPAFAIMASLLCFAAFIWLITAFVKSDFTLQLVYLHSHTQKPLLYKITASWGNHEGSMLLWCAILSGYSLFITIKQPINEQFRLMMVAIMGLLQVIFLSYLRFFSTPFIEMLVNPKQGMGFNPLLQDIGLAMHPPTLYLGYVGLCVPFVMAVGLLINPNVIDFRLFSKYLQSYVIFAWTLLTAGIALGSWWAYRELGWGGWWFWDPVENVALLPWLSATALLHCNVILRRDDNLVRLVIILSLINFVLSLVGTFLVRSGLLNSVHSFASDPSRGLVILIMIALISGGGLMLYLRKASRLPAAKPIFLFSKQSAILFNNWLLLLAMMMILLATFYPFIMELWQGQMITIGVDYYNPIFTILMLPLVAVCGLSHFLFYDRLLDKIRLQQLIISILPIITIVGFAGYFLPKVTLLLMIGLLIGGWLMFVTIKISIILLKNKRMTLSISKISMLIAHFALGLFVVSVSLFGAFHKQAEFVMRKGEVKTAFNQYQISLRDVKFGDVQNYLYQQGDVRLMIANQEYVFNPQERFYPAEQQFTAEAAIKTFLTRDIYITMKRQTFADVDIDINDQFYIIKIYDNPAMLFLWLSCILFAIAGVIIIINNF